MDPSPIGAGNVQPGPQSAGYLAPETCLKQELFPKLHPPHAIRRTITTEVRVSLGLQTPSTVPSPWHPWEPPCVARFSISYFTYHRRLTTLVEYTRADVNAKEQQAVPHVTCAMLGDASPRWPSSDPTCTTASAALASLEAQSEGLVS